MIKKPFIWLIGDSYQKNHRYRRQKKAFNGNIKERIPSRVLMDEDVFEMVKDLKLGLGKKN